MPVFKDQIGRKVEINTLPKRIISVVPSQTELLYDLGCGNEIIGQTIFCIHPKEKFKTANKVGGPKKLNISKIISLKPDLIIANKEENIKEEIEELEKYYPVWVSNIATLDEAFIMIASIGEICQKIPESKILIEKIKNDFAQLQTVKVHSCIYMIWRNPYMAVGTNTFIDDMIKRAGFANIIENMGRYPVLEVEQMKELKPDYVFLSSEPYPFKEKHKPEFEKIFPDSKLLLVDGEMFTWYGSRLQYSVEYFKRLKES